MLNRNKLAVATSESDENTEVRARQECFRLTKQLRLLENDKKSYSEESRTAIELQKKVINSLEKENLEVSDELRIKKEKHALSKEDEQQILDIMTKLLKRSDEYSAENQRVREEFQRLSLIRRRVKKLETQDLQNVESEETSLQIGKLQSKLFQMNKKLETVTAQFDALVASNASARIKIDEVLGENISITRKLTQLGRHVEQKKLVVHELVQEATAAYDQREEASSKMNALSERSLKEKRQFALEIGELTRVIRNEEKLLNFLSTKNKERTFLETDEERMSRVELAKEQILDHALESYRDNFETLLNPASQTFSALVEEYSELHESNIRQFAQINELTTEIEHLQTETSKLRQQIRKYSTETVQVNLNRRREIEDKQEEFEKLKLEGEVVDEQYQQLNLWISTIVKLIEQIFHLTDQTESISVLELVGSQTEINSENMVLYTSILEQRIKEVMKTKSEKDRSIIGISANTPSPLTLSPLVPSKALSDIALNRPRILITEKANSEQGFGSDGETHYDLIKAELNPLTYSKMKYKILDASAIRSRHGSNRSSISGDDLKSIT